MPRQQMAQGLNKEKLAFLATAFVMAAGVYLFVVTSPLLLEAGQPISMDDHPKPARDIAPPLPESEDYYVVDGKITLLTDKLTGQLVNRQRKTPFMPDADFLAALGGKGTGQKPTGPKLGGVGIPPPPPLPPPPAVADKDKKKKGPREFTGSDAESLVDFVSIITMGGVTYGQLRTKDGSRQLNVKVGDALPGLDYTVKLIEKQAITVADADGHVFLLKDDSVATADTSSSDSRADPAEAGGKGGKGGGKDGGKDGGKGGGKGGGKDKGKHDKGGKQGGDKGPVAATQPGAKPMPPGGGPGGPGGNIKDIMDKIKALGIRVDPGQFKMPPPK